MSTLCFDKYEGAGNDFILIDDRPLVFPSHDKQFIARLCHRKFGIGADGLILLQPSHAADFRMRIFNSDGGEAEGCGNGLRCLVRYLADLGLSQTSYQIEMGHRIMSAQFVGDQVGVEMGLPTALQLKRRVGEWEVHSVDTGVPHAVIFVPDVDQIELCEEAPPIRHHPLFQPRGINVNFATLRANGAIQVRTFERGVEGETLACGTGAAAVALIAAQLHSTPNPIFLHFRGGLIQAFLDDDLRVTILGTAKRVFSGVF